MEERETKKLGKWRVEVWKEPDYDADTDYLGTYSHTPESDYAIETGRSGNYFEYFNPPHDNYLGCDEEEIRKYCQQDFKHAESYNKSWSMIAIKANIYYGDVRLGTSAIFGIEDIWIGENEWHDEVKADILSQAFGEARQNLKTLKEIL